MLLFKKAWRPISPRKLDQSFLRAESLISILDVTDFEDIFIPVLHCEW